MTAITVFQEKWQNFTKWLDVLLAKQDPIVLESVKSELTWYNLTKSLPITAVFLGMKKKFSDLGNRSLNEFITFEFGSQIKNISVEDQSKLLRYMECFHELTS